MSKVRIPANEQAMRDLQAAGYTLIKQKRLQGASGALISDLVAWGGGADGEFAPRVSVEVKPMVSAAGQGYSMMLARLNASSASLGTTVNLVFADGEWFEADPGFMSLKPIDGPPECIAREGVVRDATVLTRLLEGRFWRCADEMRGSSDPGSIDTLFQVLNGVERNSDGLLRGLAPGVLAPPEKFVRALLATATRGRHSRIESVTPPLLSDLMAQIAAPKVGDVVFDAFAGSGNLLFSAAAQQARPDEDVVLSGWEINSSARELSERLANLLGLHVTIDLVDSSRSNWPSCDVLLSVPPFGMRLEEPAEMPFGTAKDIDVASIGWAANALRPNGRAVLLTTRGWTFRSGSASRLRSWLSETVQITGLIGLPSVSPLTNIPLLLIVIDKTVLGETVVADLGDDWVEQLTPGTGLFEALKRNR